jgi:hypothetical protein
MVFLLKFGQREARRVDVIGMKKRGYSGMVSRFGNRLTTARKWFMAAINARFSSSVSASG